MIIKTGDNDKVNWVYGLQAKDPIPLSRWYMRDAQEVAYVEHLPTGVIEVYVNTPCKIKADKVSDESIKKVVKRGEMALFDFREEEVIYSSEKKEFDRKLWGWLPVFSKDDKGLNDFAVYLAGSASGGFLVAHGTDRNLILGLFIQCAAWKLRGGTINLPEKQTSYGKALAGALLLKRSGLPPMSVYSRLDGNFFCMKNKAELPNECYTELIKIDTKKAVDSSVKVLGGSDFPKEDDKPVSASQVAVQERLLPEPQGAVTEVIRPSKEISVFDLADDEVPMSYLVELEPNWEPDEIQYPVDVLLDEYLDMYPELHHILKMRLVDTVDLSITTVAHPTQTLITLLRKLMPEYDMTFRSQVDGCLITLKGGLKDESLSYKM